MRDVDVPAPIIHFPPSFPSAAIVTAIGAHTSGCGAHQDLHSISYDA